MKNVKDLVPAAHTNVHCSFILLEKGLVGMEGDRRSRLALVADETAAVHFQLWEEECDAFEPGDILVLRHGIFSYTRNKLLLRAGKRGKVEKVGEFTMAFVETPNLSEIRWRLSDDKKTYVQQNVDSPYSRIFPPRT